MTLDTDLRDRLEQRVTTTVIGELATIDTISTDAARRDRSRRMMGGLGTIIVAAMLLIGVGAALREPDPSAVFAGQDGQELVPSSVVFHDGEYIGVAGIGEGLGISSFLFAEDYQYVVIRSEDGETWRAIDELPVIEAANVVIAQHGDSVHFLSIRSVLSSGESEGADGFEIVHRQTSDLEQFTTVIHPTPEELSIDDRLPVPVLAVARDAGVAVAFRTHPDWTRGVNDALAVVAVDADDECEVRGNLNSLPRVWPERMVHPPDRCPSDRADGAGLRIVCGTR